MGGRDERERVCRVERGRWVASVSLFSRVAKFCFQLVEKRACAWLKILSFRLD